MTTKFYKFFRSLTFSHKSLDNGLTFSVSLHGDATLSKNIFAVYLGVPYGVLEKCCARGALQVPL